MFLPSVVLSSESVPSPPTIASDSTLVAPSWSWPKLLSNVVAKGVVLIANSAGFKSVPLFATSVSNSARTAAASLSSSWLPAVSSIVTEPPPSITSALGPSSSKMILEPISAVATKAWSSLKPPISKSAWLLPLASTAAPFSMSTRL
ncbi:hypothetical protein D3C78_1255430 [compost metagenome]